MFDGTWRRFEVAVWMICPPGFFEYTSTWRVILSIWSLPYARSVNRSCLIWTVVWFNYVFLGSAAFIIFTWRWLNSLDSRHFWEVTLILTWSVYWLKCINIESINTSVKHWINSRSKTIETWLGSLFRLSGFISGSNRRFINLVVPSQYYINILMLILIVSSLMVSQYAIKFIL